MNVGVSSSVSRGVRRQEKMDTLTNGDGGRLFCSTSWGMEVHVATQWLSLSVRASEIPLGCETRASAWVLKANIANILWYLKYKFLEEEADLYHIAATALLSIKTTTRAKIR